MQQEMEEMVQDWILEEKKKMNNFCKKAWNFILNIKYSLMLYEIIISC